MAGSDGAPPQPAINSNAATTDTVFGYTFHTTSMMPAGQPQIVWTSEYVVDEAWDLTEVRWEQLLNNASLTPSFAVQVGTNWFVTDQTGTIESTDPLFDVVSLDLTTATWSALDFRHGQALAVGAPVAGLPEGDITAFGLFIEQNPADAFLRFDNITLLARKAAAIPGDANHDGAVNDLDASILGAHWRKPSGATWIEGDFNRDGAVDDRDAAILAAHWGAGAAESSVPEPGTLALLAPAVLMLLLFANGASAASKDVASFLQPMGGTTMNVRMWMLAVGIAWCCLAASAPAVTIDDVVVVNAEGYVWVRHHDTLKDLPAEPLTSNHDFGAVADRLGRPGEQPGDQRRLGSGVGPQRGQSPRRRRPVRRRLRPDR